MFGLIKELENAIMELQRANMLIDKLVLACDNAESEEILLMQARRNAKTIADCQMEITELRANAIEIARQKEWQ